MYALNFNQDIIERLRETRLPISSIDDLTGRDTTSVVVFSDYGPEDTPFQTFGFYVTDLHISGDLAGILRAIKEKHGAAGRSIDFKGRKDKPKRRAFREWIKAVRGWPGLLYVVAIDRGLMNHPKVREEMARQNAGFRTAGLPDLRTCFRMFGALMFLPTLSPYLKGKHKIGWVTDRDTIIDTPSRQDTLVRTFGYYAEQLLNKTLDDIRVVTLGVDDSPRSQEHEAHARELLSVADVAASALAASLSVDGSGRAKLSCPGPEAIDMLQEISKFRDAVDYRIEPRLSCPLLTHIILPNQNTDDGPEYTVTTLTLTYDPKTDPLLNESAWAPEGSDIHLEVFRSKPTC